VEEGGPRPSSRAHARFDVRDPSGSAAAKARSFRRGARPQGRRSTRTRIACEGAAGFERGDSEPAGRRTERRVCQGHEVPGCAILGPFRNHWAEVGLAYSGLPASTAPLTTLEDL